MISTLNTGILVKSEGFLCHFNVIVNPSEPRAESVAMCLFTSGPVKSLQVIASVYSDVSQCCVNEMYMYLSSV